ncbi:treacle protein isoform X8 [Antechinus flavipes]|uniref:treacle protein isoform X8 n=1 Tax=Antechinus flavipes TaxID=38775 RepID=UPI002235DB5F|nr:treacle protein isoform X8 [Antechinus flavipes]
MKETTFPSTARGRGKNSQEDGNSRTRSKGGGAETKRKSCAREPAEAGLPTLRSSCAPDPGSTRGCPVSGDMTEARKRRELLPLIHHHLVQAGYVRAARELKLQSGQKTFPEQSVTLLDIYTHWQQTSRVAKKRKAEEADGEIPYKVRVSDPTSSSESSEEEKEQERMGKTVKTLRVLHSNSVSVIKDTQCKNSLSPKEKVKTKNKKGTAVTSALHPDPLEAQTASGKPDPTVSVQSHSKKSPAAPRKQATQPASNSLATHSEEKVASPVVKLFPKPATMPLDKKTESSNEDSSSDETDIEMEKPMGIPQGNSVPVKGDPAALASTKGNQVIIPSPIRVVAKVPTAKEESPEETSESSDESESDDDVPWPQRQAQEGKTPHLGAVPAWEGKTTPTAGKTVTPSSKPNLGLPSQVAETQKSEESSESSEESESEEENAELKRPQMRTGGEEKSPVKILQNNAITKKVASAPSQEPQGKEAFSSLGKSGTRTVEIRVPLAVDSSGSETTESSEESDGEEETSTLQAQVRPSGKTPVKATPAPLPKSLLEKGALQPSGKMATAAPSTKGTSPAKGMRPGGSEDSSESSDESESEVETPTSQGQAVSSVKTPQLKASPSPTTMRPLGKGVLPTSGKLVSAASNGKGPSPTKAVGAGKPEESSSESSDETDSDVEVPVSQGQTKPSVKTPQINTSAPKLDTITSISSKGTQGRVSTPAPCKSGTLPLQAKAAGPGRLEDTSESSEESESEEESPTSRGKAKPTMKASQVDTPPGKGAPVIPLSSQDTQGRVSTPAPCKSGTLPLQAKASGPGRHKDTSESSEESESEEESPASRGQAKLAVKTPQADTILGKGTSVSPKGTQGKASTLSALKSGTVPLQAKGEVQQKIGWLGKPENTSESSEDSECEESIPVSQVQVKPAVILPIGLEGKKGTTASSPKKSAVPSLQAMKVDSSSSEESSSSSDEVVIPPTQRQAKPTMKASQVDTPPGKRAPVTPLSTKDTQERISTPALWKSGSVPLQAKAAGSGRPEDTSESSEESESEEEVKSSAQIPQSKAAEKSMAPVTTVEETSSESSQDTESEGEVPTPQGQIKTAMKSTQINTASGRESRSISASGKPVPSSQATKTEPISPEEPSDSSEESESEDEVISVQIKTVMKTPEVAAASARKSEPVPAPRKSAIPSPQTQVRPPAQSAETSGSEESSSSSDESGSELVSSASPEQVSSGKKTEKAGTVKNNVGKVSTALPDKQLAAPDTTRNHKSESNNGEPPTAQTTCDKNKTTKQDKKSKLAERTQATANQDSISVTASNGIKSEKEDSDATRAKQAQSLVYPFSLCISQFISPYIHQPSATEGTS